MRDFHLPGRSQVFALNGMAATSHPIGARVAVDILQAGGNAVDAAIAGAVVLGLCEPQMTGIGGDCFALIKPAGSEDVIAVNGSGRAPAGLSAAALRNAGHAEVPPHSAHAVTVPGAIDAFDRMARDWGRIGLAAILAPAIRYATDGVPVAPRVAADWAEGEAHLQGAARDFYLFDGKAPDVGQVFRHAGQAEVLRRIAAQGRDAFYTGEVAEDMVASLRKLGGSHSLDDFAATACDTGKPVSAPYRGVEIVEHPPNGQGAAALLMAGILSHFDIAAMDPFGAQRAHIEAEAAKLAYDARNRFIADPAHMTRLDHLLSPATAERLAGLIDPTRAMDSPAEVSEQVHRETIYITVVDRDRMAVSLIYSVFHSFGSGLASSKFGINFQNRGAGFTLQAGHPNEAAGGKRPMHTIIPGMIRRDGRIEMPFGVMGGAYQAAGHARFVSNLVDFGMHPQAAIDAPRSFPESGDLKLERGYAPSVRQQLVDMGHRVVTPDSPIGGAQTIRLHASGVLEGASDPRKDGCALGY